MRSRSEHATGRTWRTSLALAVAVASLLTVAVSRAPAFAAGEPPPLDPPVLRRAAAGYWFAAADGGVFSFGAAEFHGSMGGTRLVAPVVGMAATPSGGGYWMVARDGGVFAFGNARFLGSMGGKPLNRPIVGMAATPTGAGYWLVAADGGLFAFGDAAFYGSTGAMTLNKPIVAMAATPAGRGYWLVASDGGVFSFGDAAFQGSTGNIPLNAPIVAMTSTPTGNGYWMVATDGGIFAFGDAAFLGSTGAMKLNRPIVGMTHTGFGSGYWLIASDGGVFSFGDATFYGSTGNLQLTSPVVAVAPRPRPGSVEAAVFYYPWYDTPSNENGDRWRHWDDANPQTDSPTYVPPDVIAADFYPARGVYSSRDMAVLDAHMADMAGAGIGRVVISWWGRGSFEDARLGDVAAAARRHGLTPAAHLEPYDKRTPETVALDVQYLANTHGIDDIWVYASDGPPAETWRTVTHSFPALRIWGHSGPGNAATTFPAYAERAGFDGIYSYDALRYSPDGFGRICAAARARRLLCSPSVNPGYDDTRIRPASGVVRSREGGARYDGYWRGAFRAGADLVSITSYNEWHEGTQIEGAVPRCAASIGCYDNYEGAYGRSGDDAVSAYMARTAAWTVALRAAAA